MWWKQAGQEFNFNRQRCYDWKLSINWGKGFLACGPSKFYMVVRVRGGGQQEHNPGGSKAQICAFFPPTFFGNAIWSFELLEIQ